MFNVVIVDDEPVIRYGLKASVNWEEEGMHLLGDYPNGYEAYEAIKDKHVDILVTDIKMPVMDGLTLMKKTLEIFPKAKVILVSSYNDFEYVREGLTHGAVDYVLKPTLEPEEFLQIIKKCIGKLVKEKNIEEKLTLLDETYSRKERKDFEYHVKSILLQDVKQDNKVLLSYFHLHPWLLIHGRVNDSKKVEEQYGVFYKSFILDEIHEQFYTFFSEGICFPISDSEIIFLLPKTKDVDKILLDVKQFIKQETATSFALGYEEIRHIDELETGFKRSMNASKRRFFHPNEEVFQFKPLKINKNSILKVSEIKQFLLPYEEQKVTDFIQSRYQVWKQDEVEPATIKDEACEILTNLFNEKVEISYLMEKCLLISTSETVDELYEVLIEQIHEINLHYLQQKDIVKADNELIEEALQYIHQSYTEELTLQDVADHIHISRNYFSILFKKQTNQNFIDYVIELRVKKAKELLVHTKMKVYEVAKQSGFKDVKYFSKLFKKMTGYSAGDYRNDHQK
ncbi:response regulator [Bacillus sp. JJ1566]|uniref:response regulator transcription factor n=1 Tax=Bacillus sp. JJ1566 TaxID=3122961 RepID=UPI0030000289